MEITNINLGACPLQYLSIGYVGETGARPVAFDFSAWATEYGSGVLQLLLQRPGDADPYPVVLDIDGTTATWTPDATATEKTGQGQAQLVYTVGGVIVKNAIFRVLIAPSLGAAGNPPEPYENWLERLLTIAAEAQQSAIDAAGSAEAAGTSAGAAAGSAGAAAQSALDAEAAKTGAESAETAAGQSAALAGEKATQATQAAQTAAQKASAAEQSAEDAQAALEAVRLAADAAETFKDDAQTAAAGANQSKMDAEAAARAAAGSATAAAAAVTEVETKGAQQIRAIEAAGTDQITAVDEAGAAQVQAVQDKGEEVLESIPEDYSDLSADVVDLKSSFKAHEQYAEETYAKQDGSYEDLTAGNAYELLSDRGDTNAQPYLFRKTGGDSSAYNREQLRKIVGGTVAFNQLVQNGNFADGRTGWSFNNCTPSVSGNKVTVSVTSGTKAVNFGLETAKKITQAEGHKYLFGFNLMVSDVSPGYARYNVVGSSYPSVVLTAGVDKRIEGIISGIDGVNRFFVYPWGTTSVTLTGNEKVEAHDYVMIDLTQMFGTAIADYIYSLEQATAGAGVAFFRSLFPADYYDYNPGELMSVEGISAHETVGFNQWDEEWEVGAYDITTGEKQVKTTQIRSKNTIPCLPNTAYYIMIPNATTVSAYAFTLFYDANGNYISNFSHRSNGSQFTTPANTCGMTFFVASAYGTTYKHDICISLAHNNSRNGEYAPYEKHSYPLDSSVILRGIPKVGANGVYWDGDRYLPDGTVERRYGVVDMGTITWTYNSGRKMFSSGTIRSAPVKSAGSAATALHGTTNINAMFNNASSDKVVCCGQTGSWNGEILVRDLAYDGDAAAFKSAMQGVMLIYELATPTTETADPYRELQIVDDWGTEEFVSTSIVPVGHETFYPVNVFDYIDRLTEPDADMIADTVIAANKYFSVGNRLFLSTTSIAAGAMIIPGTNCQETSLAAALNALNT